MAEPPQCLEEPAPFPEIAASPSAGAVSGLRLNGENVDIATGLRGDAILVPLQIKNETLQFVLDTGASVSVLDSTVAARFGQLRRSRKTYPPRCPPVFEMPAARLQNFATDIAIDAALADLTGARVVSGHAVAGLLGSDVVEGLVVGIDFDHGD